MNLEVMEGEKKSKQVHTAEAGKNDMENGSSSCSDEQFANFLTLHIFFYWMLFGQLILLLLSLFGYESLQPVVDWVSSIILSVESLRHSTKGFLENSLQWPAILMCFILLIYSN